MNDLMKLSDDLFHRVIGFNSIFDDFARPMDKYPLHNLHKKDNKYYIELAVAGFEKEDLQVERDRNRLIITGSHEDTVDNYIYKGISSRSFVKTFPIDPEYHERKAEYKNGILTIILEKEEQEKKVKVLEIK